MDGNRELISRAELLEEIAKDRAVMEKVELHNKSNLHFYLMGHDHVKDLVERIPAQPERKTGRWEPWEYARPGYEYKFHKCSVCGVCDEYVDEVPRPNGTIARIERIRNYCPNCGAKMKGDAE